MLIDAARLGWHALDMLLSRALPWAIVSLVALAGPGCSSNGSRPGDGHGAEGSSNAQNSRVEESVVEAPAPLPPFTASGAMPQHRVYPSPVAEPGPLALAPDGRYLAFGGRDSPDLWVVHLTESERIARHLGPFPGLLSLAFEPGSQHFVATWGRSAGNQKLAPSALAVYRADTGKTVHQHRTTGLLHATYCDDALVEVETTRGQVRVLDPDDHSERISFTFGPEPRRYDLACGAGTLLVGMTNQVVAWSIADGTERWRAPVTDRLLRLTISPDGRHVAFSDLGHELVLADGRTGAILVRKLAAASGDGLAFDGHSRVLAEGDRIYTVPDLGLRFDSRSGARHLRPTAISADGRSLAVAESAAVVLYDLTRRMHEPPAMFTALDVEDMAVSGDGTRLVIGADRRVLHWSVKDNEPVAESLPEGAERISGDVFVTFAGNQLLAARERGPVNRFSTSSLAPEGRFDMPVLAELHMLRTDSKGARVASFGPYERNGPFVASVHERASGRQLYPPVTGDRTPAHLFGHELLRDVSLSPGGDLLAIGGRDAVSVVALATGTPAWQLAKNGDSLRFISNGKYLLRGERGDHLVLHEWPGGRELDRLDLEHGVRELTVAGDWVVWSDSVGHLSAARARHDMLTSTWHQKSRRIDEVAIDPARKKLYAARYEAPAEVRALTDGALLGQLGHWPSPVLSMAFSPDGDRLATSTPGGRVHVWNTRDLRVAKVLGKPEHQPGEYAGESVNALRFSTDGATLHAGLVTGHVAHWNLASGERTSTGPASYDDHALLLPDGTRLMVSSSAKTLTRLAGGAATAELRPEFSAEAYALSADGTRVAFADHKRLALYDALTGQVLAQRRHQLDRVNALAMARDGRVFVYGSSLRRLHGTYWWHPRKGRQGGTVTAFAFSTDFSDGGAPGRIALDGRYREVAPGSGLLAVVGLPVVTLVDSNTELRAGSFIGLQRKPTAFAITADKQIFAAADGTGSVWLWRVADGRPVGQLRHFNDRWQSWAADGTWSQEMLPDPEQVDGM